MTRTILRLLPRGALLGAILALAAPAARADSFFWLDSGWGTASFHRFWNGGGAAASLYVPPTSMPEAIAYSPATGDIVFAEGSWANARIRRTNPGFTTPVTLIQGESCVRGIATNAVTGQIYWTTSNLVTGSEVHRCDPDGGNAQVLLNLGSGSNLRGVAVNSATGKMYLADFDHGMIYRANLDGTQFANFQATGSGPWGVALDPTGQTLYWCEYASGQVRSVPVAGGPVTTLFTGRVNPTHITYYLDSGTGYLLWSEAAPGAQQNVLGYLDGSAAYPTVLTCTAYGGITVTPSADVGVPVPQAVARFSLSIPAPNPVVAASVIEFGLATEQHARLTIVDVQGRRVASLVDATLPAGGHSVSLAAAWAARRPAAGIYFLRLEAGGLQLTRKLVVAD